MTTNEVDRLLKAVSARIPSSVTPDTRIEIHPSEWLMLANEISDLRAAAEPQATQEQTCGYCGKSAAELKASGKCPLKNDGPILCATVRTT